MARHPVEFHPKAIAEARAARLWYSERNRAAADAFVKELDRSLTLIEEQPKAWPPFLHGTQHHVMRRFPFHVIYRLIGDTVQVIAVAHARRRPGYWMSR